MDTIKRVSRRAPPHTRKEIGVAVPSTANSNPPASIFFKVFVVRIIAAITHSYPSSVFSGRLAFAMLIIGVTIFATCFSMPTAAGCCIVLPQSVGGNFNFVAAGAAAKPEKISAFVALGEFTDNHKAIVSLPCDINESGHGDLLPRLSRQVATGRLTAQSPRILQENVL